MDKKMITCPKCGQDNNLLSIDCCKCGIVFSKYYGILARDETDEGKRSDLLRKKEAEEAKAEALIKQQEEEAKAEALIKQQEEEAKAEALRKQKEEKIEEEKKDLQKKADDIINVLKPKTKIKDLLKKYEGQTIGINYDSSTEIKCANLVKAGDDLFSILIMDDELMKSYPLRTIMSIIEGVDGVSTDTMEGKSPFSIVIQVYHPVS